MRTTAAAAAIAAIATADIAATGVGIGLLFGCRGCSKLKFYVGDYIRAKLLSSKLECAVVIVINSILSNEFAIHYLIEVGILVGIHIEQAGLVEHRSACEGYEFEVSIGILLDNGEVSIRIEAKIQVALVSYVDLELANAFELYCLLGIKLNGSIQ